MKNAEYEFIKFMMRFDATSFEIVINEKKYIIGKERPEFRIILHKTPALCELMTSTSITLGEGYMDGNIEIDGDLYEALNMFIGQISKFCTDSIKLKKLIFTSCSKHNQLKQVSSHYDIGNDFYKLWLDKSMSYSCGYFKTGTDTLYQAQYNKVERILEKLYIQDGMSICDIGCGWGFLLIEAAKKYKIHGLGITLSKEQKKEFDERIKAEHLEEYLDVKLMDYRDTYKLNCRFDRIVSVGMVEHVGRENYEEFLECMKKLLKPGGLFLLHFISALKEYPGDAWLKKYIFPGGVVPSLRELIQIAGDMEFCTLDVESLRRHYNRTLLCWNSNFQDHKKEAESMFDSRFVRMWELYLCSCAAAFQNGIVDIHQILFTNGVNNELPMTRWY